MKITTTLKVQIHELRSQGLGYKRIAKALDLNASTVKVSLKNILVTTITIAVAVES